MQEIVDSLFDLEREEAVKKPIGQLASGFWSLTTKKA